MMDVEIIPCDLEHLEKLIEGADAFQKAYGFQVAMRTVEMGYSIAPAYQRGGLATFMVHQLIAIAFESTLVDCVCAHTLAEPNASTRVLEKCGMTKVSESIDPDVGKVWRWETWMLN